MAAWQSLVRFFELRPFFTLWWLRVFWLIFLLSQLRGIYLVVRYSYPHVGSTVFESWVRLFFSLLDKAVYIIAVRLLLEVAIILLTRREPEAPKH
jgi:hypothetical protein